MIPGRGVSIYLSHSHTSEFLFVGFIFSHILSKQWEKWIITPCYMVFKLTLCKETAAPLYPSSHSHHWMRGLIILPYMQPLGKGSGSLIAIPTRIMWHTRGAVYTRRTCGRQKCIFFFFLIWTLSSHQKKWLSLF